MHDEKENRQCDPGCGDVFVPGRDVLSDGSISYECVCYDEMESAAFKYCVF